MDPVQLPTRDEVINACTDPSYLDNKNSSGFAYNNEIWINYGSHLNFAEARVLQYLQENVDKSIVYTPVIYDYFSAPRPNDLYGRYITYIVMENIASRYISVIECLRRHPNRKYFRRILRKTVEGLQHIWGIDLPINSPPGPFGEPRQIPKDWFFSDKGPGRTFSTMVELQDWINTRLVEHDFPKLVDFSSLPLQICHNNIAMRKILVSEDHLKESPIAIVNWQMSGIYPRVFEEFVLRKDMGNIFMNTLVWKLFGPEVPALMEPMTCLSKIQEYGRWKCGINEDDDDGEVAETILVDYDTMQIIRKVE